MCVVIVVPKGVDLPTLEEFKAADRRNPHGMGYAISRHKFDKGWMNAEKFYEAVNSVRRKNQTISLHFRIATHGDRSKDNMHPHVAGKVLLMHNGVLTQFKPLIKTESDTAAMARLISAYDLKTITSDDGMVAIQNMFYGDKGVIITPNGEHWLINKEKFTEHEGRFYSNTHHFPPKVYTPSATTTTAGLGHGSKGAGSRGYWVNGKYQEYSEEWDETEMGAYFGRSAANWRNNYKRGHRNGAETTPTVVKPCKTLAEAEAKQEAREEELKKEIELATAKEEPAKPPAKRREPERECAICVTNLLYGATELLFDICTNCMAKAHNDLVQTGEVSA